MFLRAAFILALLTSQAFALAGQQRSVYMQPPGWVLRGAAIDSDLAHRRYWASGQGYLGPQELYATTRASTKYCLRYDGIWIQAANNVQCIADGGGSLIEESRTNLALWSRDMTQSGTWIAVTMTAALNAIGIDGSANSATTLTSTSAAGTILQSLTAASTAYTYSVFVKGVTVTGAIQVADYPVLTPAFTTLTSSNCVNPVTGAGTAPASGQTAFVLCTVTATSLNPVIGFKFANSGDSIVVDFNQLEAASFGTSPILTTSASATRAADAIIPIGLLTTLISGPSGGLSVLASSTNAAASPGLIGQQNRELLTIDGTTAVTMYNGSVTLLTTAGSGSWTSTAKAASSWGSSGRKIVMNNGTVASDTNVVGTGTGSIGIGSAGASSGFVDGYLARLSAFNSTTLAPTQ